MPTTSAFVFVHIATHFAEMLRVAELLRSSARYRPVVLFNAMYEGVEADIEACRRRDIDVVTADGYWRYLPPQPPRTGLRRFLFRQWRWARAKFLRGTRSGPVWWLRLGYRAARHGAWVAARALLDLARGDNPAVRALRAVAWVLLAPFVLLLGPQLRRLALASFGLVFRRLPFLLPPDIAAQRYFCRVLPRLVGDHDVRLLVVPEDNFFYFTNLLIRAVHGRGGAAVVVPFTIVNTLEWSEAFYREPACDASLLVNRVVAELFPAWVHTHRGRRLVLPAQQVIAAEYHGAAPPVPWLINSGHADAIAAESPFMADYYRRAGIPERQIRTTGALSDDVLHRGLAQAPQAREALYREAGLPAGRPMVLCALPPNQLRGSRRPQCAYRDYREILEAFVAPLEDLAGECNVVVNLHPRITPEEAAVLEGRRVFVSRRNIADLVPLARVYVASASATIRLAVSCGIPVVNYDVYVYDYDDYRDVPGVATVRKHEDYEAWLDGLTRVLETYAKTQAAIREFARDRVILDGKAGERMLALFDGLLESRAVPP